MTIIEQCVRSSICFLLLRLLNNKGAKETLTGAWDNSFEKNLHQSNLGFLVQLLVVAEV